MGTAAVKLKSDICWGTYYEVAAVTRQKGGMMKCPKCGSKLIRDSICCKCGTYIYPQGFTPIVKRAEFVPEGNKTRIGTCENCNRSGLYLHGVLCGSCAASVKPVDGRKIVRGSREYEHRLKVIKDRIKKNYGGRYANQN